MKKNMDDINKIVELIIDLAKKETHPDKVSCLHAALISVNMAVGQEMLKIRESEKKI